MVHYPKQFSKFSVVSFSVPSTRKQFMLSLYINSLICLQYKLRLWEKGGKYAQEN